MPQLYNTGETETQSCLCTHTYTYLYNYIYVYVYIYKTTSVWKLTHKNLPQFTYVVPPSGLAGNKPVDTKCLLYYCSEAVTRVIEANTLACDCHPTVFVCQVKVRPL